MAALQRVRRIVPTTAIAGRHSELLTEPAERALADALAKVAGDLDGPRSPAAANVAAGQDEPGSSADVDVAAGLGEPGSSPGVDVAAGLDEAGLPAGADVSTGASVGGAVGLDAPGSLTGVDVAVGPDEPSRLLAGFAGRPSLATFADVAAAMVGPINEFFDGVLVMAEDPDVRAARLGLLAAVRDLANGVLDWAALPRS